MIHTWLRKDALGYDVHTNRELGLMLRGTKPLSVFSDQYEAWADVVIRYLTMFERYVGTGRFEKREYVELRPSGSGEIDRIHVVMFALPHESWRIDKMIKLREELSHWSADAERREGELLGYEGWQNDIWMRERFGRA